MRPSFLKNQILIFAVGCVLTLGMTSGVYADGCWGSSRGGWGSGGGSFGSRGGLFSNQPARSLLSAVGNRVGTGLANVGNGIVNVLERQPLRNALSSAGCNGSSWGGSRGGSRGGSSGLMSGRFSGSRGGWGCSGGLSSTGGWGSGGSSYGSTSSLLTAPSATAPAEILRSPAPEIVSTDSLLDLPIVTTGGYGSVGGLGSYDLSTQSIGFASGLAGHTISPVGLTHSFLAAPSLSQIETSTHVLDYGYYEGQNGLLDVVATDSVMIDNTLITGPMLETEDGSNNVIEAPPSSDFDFPADGLDGNGGGSEPAPDDVFGAEEDDSVYLPRGKAVLTLHVPRDAKVYINDRLTRTKGDLRRYVSRNLAFGEKYRYRVRVVAMVDGKEVTKNREVAMRGGAQADFAFNFEPIVTRLALNVPEDAKVVIDGKSTSATGALRSFSTEKLKTGKWEDYSVEVSVVRDGKTVTKRESFDLVAGEFRFLEFDFDRAAAGKVAAK